MEEVDWLGRRKSRFKPYASDRDKGSTRKERQRERRKKV